MRWADARTLGGVGLVWRLDNAGAAGGAVAVGNPHSAGRDSASSELSFVTDDCCDRATI